MYESAARVHHDPQFGISFSSSSVFYKGVYEEGVILDFGRGAYFAVRGFIFSILLVNSLFSHRTINTELADLFFSI